MHPLLLQLDLDHPGLEEANALARASRIHEALAAVVRYFRARPEPDPSLLATPNPGAVEASERAIAREFVFYQVPGKVPPGNWDWTWRPGTDWEWTYALNRHHWWAELAAAYLATGDQRYAQELDSLIRSWVGQCPVHVDDISSWRTLETGIRVAGPWIGILSAMKATPVITDTAWIMYLRAIHDHAEHLVANPKANNWLLVESNGLLTCGIVFPEFRRAKDWVRTAVERFEREMEQSVHPDGAHIEYSSSYHFLSLHSFTAAMDKADRTVGRVFSDEFRNRLELMWEYPMYMMRPDGRLPLLNDSDTANIRPQLRAAGVPTPIDVVGQYFQICRDLKNNLFTPPFSSPAAVVKFFQKLSAFTGESLPLDTAGLQAKVGVKGKVWRISAEGKSGNVTKTITTVVDTSTGRLVYWRE